MTDFTKLALEVREQIQNAIFNGPASKIKERLDQVLDNFEAKLIDSIDDEAVKRAKLYIDGFKNVL